MSSAASASEDGGVLSLLSLSIAAANAAPIPITAKTSTDELSVKLPAAVGINPSISSASDGGAGLGTSTGNGAKQHRRLASTGKARRRLSDARDAAARPTATTLHASAAALSLASLSLSSSLPQGQGAISMSPNLLSSSASGASNISASVPEGGDFHVSNNVTVPVTTVSPIPINGAKGGKKRGIDYKCESCSKIYRHPSCLIKHRWEHTPHWREASKFVLSKHQQVQLLEAAAILSHLSPSATGTSLPEDRSLWPSFLSGGTLPLPANDSSTPTVTATPAPIPTSSSPDPVHPVSSSVPAATLLGYSRPGSTGPRMHDYSIPVSATGTGTITQVRPGLVGVPTGPGAVSVSEGTNIQPSQTQPVPVPNAAGNSHSAYGPYRSFTGSSDSWGSPQSYSHSSHFGPGTFSSSSYKSVNGGEGLSTSPSRSYAHSDERNCKDQETDAGYTGGWSLPRSSLRSVSASSNSHSRSRSRSMSAPGSRSDEESIDIDVDMDPDEHSSDPYHYHRPSFASRGRKWKVEEEDPLSVGFGTKEDEEELHDKQRAQPEWDGMEMDMEMD